MSRRYDILEKNSARDIDSYHRNVLMPAVEAEFAVKDLSAPSSPRRSVFVSLLPRKARDTRKSTLVAGRSDSDESPDSKSSTVAPSVLTVEGEIWMAKSTLERLNKEQRKNKLPPFANPRNLAAGSIRQLDPKIVAERHLDSFIYDLASLVGDASKSSATSVKSAPPDSAFRRNDTDAFPLTQHEELEFLRALGFKVNKHYKHCKNVEEVIEYWKEWQKKMPKEDYWADGIVVKVDERKYQETLGYTGKAP